MKKIRRQFGLLALGGAGYGAIELLWRPEEPLSDGARRLIAFLGKRDERRTGARKSENEK